MKIAIMQPYFLPYIGYFQLINMVDKFIILDDVNFINRGWINRNRILINGKGHLFSIPCAKTSQNKLINEIEIALDEKGKNKLLLSFELAYKKAPYFNDVFYLLIKCLNFKNYNLAKFTANSIIEVCNFLKLEKKIKYSSIAHPETKEMGRVDRLIEITKREKSNEYINPIGGQKIYNKEYFASKGVNLAFLKSGVIEYPQFKSSFVSWLSIIDVLMFNNTEKVKELLNKCMFV